MLLLRMVEGLHGASRRRLNARIDYMHRLDLLDSLLISPLLRAFSCVVRVYLLLRVYN